MLHTLTIAFAATAAIGIAAVPTGASAAWHGHGGWHGGWRGPGWGFYG
jgi:hypothetical protein